MKIIISPAKTMIEDSDTMMAMTEPIFLHKTKEILSYLQTLSYEELKELWGCNDKIAQLNKERIDHMRLERGLTPALISYEGIQYQSIGANVLSQSEWDYLENHLRILSGFYGILRPLDGVTPYRLEMQAKANVDNKGDLYHFWGNLLYEQLKKESNVILNLASKEYSKTIEIYRKEEQKQKKDVMPFVTCIFGEEKNGKVVQKATMAKMARGEMVRFLAENQVEKLEDVKKFNRMNFVFSEKYSKEDMYTFILEQK